MLRFTEFRIDASKITEFPDGSIKIQGQLTHPGVFHYKNSDGTDRREYRPKEEVFHKASLETYAGATVTMNHPRGHLVTAQTWRKDAIGHLGENAHEDVGHVVADVYVRDATAVAAVKSGDARFISLGYGLEYEPNPGTAPDGSRFDGIQRNIRVNHVALLPKGVTPRGGSECVLRLDSEGNEEFQLNSEVDMTPEQIVALQAQLTALQGELAKVRTDAAEVPALRASVADLTAKLEKATAEVTPARLDSLVEERVTVLGLAKSAGVKDVAGKSNLDIKRAVIASRTPALATRVDSFSAETADAVLSTYTEQPHPSLAVLGTSTTVDEKKKTETVRTDARPAPSTLPTYADLYSKSVQASATRWQNAGDHPVKGN
jgi:hypothetical protein